MRVLIIYHPQTEDLEETARAICDEYSKEHDEVDLKKIEEADAEAFNKYDLIVLGTPTQLQDLPANVKEIGVTQLT